MKVNILLFVLMSNSSAIVENEIMGNNMVSSVIKVFDRSHLEIDSISAKIDRERINGCHEKHEVYVENFGIFRQNVDINDRNEQNQVHE